MGGAPSSAILETYMQSRQKNCNINGTTSKICEQFVDEVCSILKCKHLENVFHRISNLYPNIKFTMEEESNGNKSF